MIKIISPDNGVAHGTKFVDADTGQEIPLSVCIDPPATVTFGKMITLKATIGLVQYEGVAGRVNWVLKHPVTGDYEPVSRIIFRDGVEMVLQGNGTVIVNNQSA